MSTTSKQRASPPGTSPAPVQWRCWPVAEGVLRTALVGLALVLAAILVGWVTGHAYLALPAAVALAAALWRFFVPVAFELTDRGVEQRVLGWRRQIPWGAIRHYEIGTDGVWLSPHDPSRRLSRFRGLYLPWRAHREEVLTQIDHHLGAKAAANSREKPAS